VEAVPEANDVHSIDATDQMLLSLLAVDGRMSNRALADAAGIAPSTCLTRLRQLRRIGAVRGVHADIDPAWFGSPIQAMVAVRVRGDARSQIDTLAKRLAVSRVVLNVFFVSGAYDFLVHIAAADSAALRQFVVEDLNALPVVSSTETHLIFEHTRGAFPLVSSTGSDKQRKRARAR
jgi:DNA-binding Lrp family transcriptional regulator